MFSIHKNADQNKMCAYIVFKLKQNKDIKTKKL